MGFPESIKPESWMKALVYGVLMAAVFYTSHQVMIASWRGEDYNYGYLIAPVALYLIWESRAKLAAVKARPSWAGLVFVGVGVGLYFLGELGGEYTAMFIASWFVLVGLLWLHLGWRKLKVIWFPVVFLLTMFPPPAFFQYNLTLRLKLLSSKIGVWILQAYGMSAYRDGNIIDLGFTQLQVVDACSGLRYLYPMVIMALLLTYFHRGAFWKKAVLVVSAVPLTIVTNSLRIALTGILYELWGAKVAEGFFHGFSGWAIFIFGLAVLILELWVMNGFRSIFGPRAAAVEGAGEEGDIKEPEAVEGGGFLRALFSPPQFVAAVVVLGATLVVAQTVEFREKVPPAKPFKFFPVRVGEWQGRVELMERDILDELDLSDYVMVDYVNGEKKAVNFYTAYYESQRKGESIHSPETCLPGGGWVFQKAGGVTLPVTGRDGKPLRVNRAFMEKGDFRQVAYFWFPMRDRVLTTIWQLKLYNFWDALTRQRTDGALVRLVTPVYPGEEVADADRRLVAFAREIVPVLEEFLPR